MDENYAQQSLSGKLAMLRHRVKMSQGSVAELLDVSLTTVNNWETGTTSPNAKNLQKVIALYLEKGGFTAGKEREEARQLWSESTIKARFDDEWFEGLLASCMSSVVEKRATESVSDTVLQGPIVENDDDRDMGMQEQRVAEPQDESQPAENSSLRQPAGMQGDPTLQNWERQRLLKINSFWIQSWLAQTWLHRVHVELKLRASPNTVASPQSHMLDMEQPEHAISSDITRIYDEMGGTLLILGEPGSGKTFLALELARTLLTRAYENKDNPIPIVLNLSSWAQKRLPLTQWIAEELNERYQIPHKVSTALVASEQLLPLLDGLDEVPAPLRSACIMAINKFRLEYGLLPLVVCTRSTEYLAQEKRLLLRGGIEILPLTTSQIEYYLAQAAVQSNRTNFDAIRAAIQSDTRLQEQVSTPLMLSVLTQAYQGDSLDNLPPTDDPEAVRQHVFTHYVDCMLSYRNQKKTMYYQPWRVRRWLSWLSQQMARRNQSEFYLERIQADWLPPGPLRQLLPIAGVGSIYALFLGLIKGAGYAFSQGADQYGRSFGPTRGLIDGFVIAAICWLTFIVLNGFLISSRRRVQRRNRQRWWHFMQNPIVNRIGYGIVYGFILGCTIGVLVDVPAGIYNGWFCSIIFMGLGPLDIEIKPAEILFWSWSTAQRQAPRFVGLGMLVGIVYGLLTAIYWQLHVPEAPLFSRFFSCLLLGLSIGLVLGLFILLIQSTSYRMMDKPSKPNKGIWNSMRNSLLLGGGAWLLFGIFFGVVYSVLLHLIFHLFGIPYSEYSRYFPKDTGIVMGLTYGLIVGAFFWLRNGGTACILHFSLRLLLWQAGCTPWCYSRFLDYAAQQVILQKLGGGYIFIHRLLLEHFEKFE